ncbi:hypothetical protein [Candidatus Spongiihabitans sp.]|uniref:hypothetical protein n=1 Tax=Candidatus Spongiihabitans sp. TaxID=3101308 RepID=UPI003C6F1E5C
MLRYCIAAVVIATTTLLLAGCGESTQKFKAHAEPPVTMELIDDDSGLTRLIFTQQAINRLGIETAAITEEAGKRVAPYSALLYDSAGGTWVYINPQGLEFRRASVEVDRIRGDKAYLDEGPSVGSKVVTVGAAELFGAEYRVGG